MSNVSGVIKSIQDIMRKDVGVDGDAQRISQLVWMFFLKIFDDREAELEVVEDNYHSPLPEHLRWRNWAANKEGITGDELSDFVNLQLFPRLKDLTGFKNLSGLRAQVIHNVFEDAYNYMKSGTLMRQVINKISEIDFNTKSDRHTFGNIYEQILKDLQSAGNAGEFYTPRAVTAFMVDRVKPQLDETVLDPACGTGGFLSNVIEYKREHFVRSAADEEILQATIHGVEKKTMPHMLCTTNMILHGIDTPINIRHDNTLSRPLRDYTNKDRVHVIVTNPPFGGMEEDGIENNFPATLRSRETADLFLTLIIHLLKTEGRAALVLPDGFLFGEGIKTRIKEKLLTECNLHTIVRLPNGVFSPYTGIKTNLLFFTKGQPTETVWYYEHPYPDGVTSYNKTKPMRFEEFQPEIAWWGNESDGFSTRIENETAWKVSIEEIKARNYNLDIKNPHVGEQINHDPDKLLKRYQEQQKEISELQDKLKSILDEALNHKKSELESTWQRVSNQFNVLFNTEYSIDRIKQTILQIAMMGKLLPQNIEDESARELLKKITKEKARLIREGKIKKQEQLSEISENERPYQIPNKWIWTKLGNLSSDIHYGYTASADFQIRDVRLLRITDIQNDSVNWESVPGCEIEKKNIATYQLKEGDILIARTGGTIGKSFLVDELDLCVVFASYLIRVKHIDGMYSQFIKKYLGSKVYWNQLYKNSMGTGQPNVNGIALKNLMFPLPPIAEQQRIVAKVDELFAICDALKERIKEAQRIQMDLADAVTDISIKS